MNIKAYIQWEITDDNDKTVASSYEHINSLGDIQYWANKMEEYLNGERGDYLCDEDEEPEDYSIEYDKPKLRSPNKISVSYKHKLDAESDEKWLEENGYTKTYQGKTGSTWEKLDDSND